MQRGVFALIAMCAVLAGCGESDSAAMRIQGGDHALTLVRTKEFIFSDGWELEMVVSRMPDCMRRHKLKKAGDGKFKVDVYRSAEGAWIMRQGKKWYVADTQSCQLQKFDEAPPEPGTFVGQFEDKSGTLKFVQSPDLVKPGEKAKDE